MPRTAPYAGKYIPQQLSKLKLYTYIIIINICIDAAYYVTSPMLCICEQQL